MEARLVALSQLADEDLLHLAMLHHSVMHTLLSDLGLPLVYRYYQIARADPDVLGFCMCADGGEILGWAMGSPHPDKINTRLRSPLIWFLAQMLRVLIRRPIVFGQLLLSVRAAANQEDVKKGAIELTYIGVAPRQRGKRLGHQLLQAFIEASRTQGYRSVVLSVETGNAPAISLYERTGFQVINTFSEGRYQRHRMELTIA